MRALIGAVTLSGMIVSLPFGLGEAAAQQAVERTTTPNRVVARWSADEMRRILDRAVTHRSEGNYAEATKEILRLWDCPLELMDFEMHQVRGMATIIAEDITASHGPSQRAFFELRGRLGEQMQGDEVDLFTVHDWVRMNATIGDEARSMYFYDEIKNDPAASVILELIAGTLLHQAFVERRWDVLSDLVVDPAVGALNLFEIAASTLDEVEKQIGIHPFDDPSWVAGLVQMQIIAALHTDDRGKTERRLVEALEKAMPGHDAWRIAFIHSAGLCGKLRSDHIAWVEQYDLATKYAHDPVIMQLISGAKSSP